jgi:DNA mismatch repair protein MutL
MGRVRVLEESVANKIAAGEVVERPASVVKELVENALDAGATSVLVELRGGGRDLVRVSDDGEGMAPEDAQLAILPHATSKVETIADLAEIGTFGFRGEALPSIASVSHFVLMSRRALDEQGILVAVEGGAVPRVEPVGCSPGTVVAVHHLFYNTPARLKFLKQSRTELGRAVDLVGRMALAFPAVQLEVRNEEKTVFRSDPSPGIDARLADVLGREALRSLIAFEEDAPLARVWGYTADLTLHHANRAQQFVFVNRRTIRSPVLSRAISVAYEGLIPPGRHPTIVLFLEMDPRLVDPNVHPTKQEVRFPREDEVFRLVFGALRAALLGADLVPQAAQTLVRPGVDGADPSRAPQAAPQQLPSPDRQRELHLGSRDAEHSSTEQFRAVLAQRIEDDAREGGGANGARSAAPAPAVPSAAVEGSDPGLSGVRVIGQAMNSYIIADAPSGELLLIDQHAAHERVLYERFLGASEGARVPSQGLLLPETVELSSVEFALLTDALDMLADLGLVVEPFGGNTALIRSVPQLGRRIAPTRMLKQLLADLLDDQSEFRSLRDLRQRVCATAACKAAVKQGDPLTREEMEGLLHDLDRAGVKFTCPHARPAIVRLSRTTLDGLFLRHS